MIKYGLMIGLGIISAAASFKGELTAAAVYLTGSWIMLYLELSK